MNGSPGRRALRLALAVLAGFLVVGCSMALSLDPSPSPSSSPTATATLAPLPTSTPAVEPLPDRDWTEYKLAAQGFSLALPSSWRAVDADAPQAGDALRAFGARLPGQASALPAERPEIRFLAFDVAPEGAAGDLTANLNILQRHLDSPSTLAEFGSGNAAEVVKMQGFMGHLEQEGVVLPVGAALRLRYQLAVGAEGGPEDALSLTQLLLVRGGEGYVLTFATTPSQAEHYAGIFAEIGRSFRWLGN